MSMPTISLIISTSEVIIIEMSKELLCVELANKFIEDLLMIKLLKPRVLTDELRHCIFHQPHHRWNLHGPAESLEFIDNCTGLLVVVLAYLGDEDAAVVGRDGVLLGGEDFFIEFLAWTETAVLDLDVLVRSEAGKLDHAAGEVVDLHGFSHVEYEDLVAC